MFSRNVGLFSFFFFFFFKQSLAAYLDFFVIFLNKVLQNWVMSAKRVGFGKLGYFKWWVMSDENWVKSDEWLKKKQTNSPLVSVWHDNFVNLFYYSACFCYYSWVSLYFLVLFMGSTILFQLTFTFIYSTFNKKFSVLTKKADPK